MFTIFALTLLVFTQTTLAYRSRDDDSLSLKDLSRLLDAEKRYADEYAVGMRRRKTTTIKPGYERRCNQDPIDLGLIIDSSVSIRKDDYFTGLQFLANFLDEYNIGPKDSQVHVAAVSFGKTVYTNDGFNLTTYQTKEEVKEHILNMPFKQGRRTDTGDAIKHMREVQMAQGRPGVAKIVVVLTDGDSQRTSYTEEQADATKKANITEFAIGVGKRIKFQELLNIAGKVKDHVFQADKYDELEEKVKKPLTLKTCILVPKPTTTTLPSTPAAQKCGEEFPTDLNFVFSAATMGLDDTSAVTSFISHVMDNKDLEEGEGFRYGVVSGDCPDDAGFQLNAYSSTEEVRAHLTRYDRNRLPYIVNRTTTERFTLASGARENAKKTAVIFLGRNKVDGDHLARSIKEMFASGVRVFVSSFDSKVLESVRKLLPNEVTILEGGPFTQVTQLINHLCPQAKKFEEGEFLPDYVYDFEGFARS